MSTKANKGRKASAKRKAAPKAAKSAAAKKDESRKSAGASAGKKTAKGASKRSEAAAKKSSTAKAARKRDKLAGSAKSGGSAKATRKFTKRASSPKKREKKEMAAKTVKPRRSEAIQPDLTPEFLAASAPEIHAVRDAASAPALIPSIVEVEPETGPVSTEDRFSNFSIPETYGRNRMTLLVKDPRWLYAYWELTPQLISGIRDEIRMTGNDKFDECDLVARTRLREASGSARLVFAFETNLHREARNWYIEIPLERLLEIPMAAEWQTELGFLGPSGRFYALLESNTVPSISSGPSRRQAPAEKRYEESGKRAVRRRLAAGIARLADAARGSAPPDARKDDEIPSGAVESEGDFENGWVEPEIPGLRELMPGSSELGAQPGGPANFPGASEGPHFGPSSFPSSAGVSSFGGPPSGAPDEKKEDDFFFWVDCEVILHGGTQPDAEVTVQGRRIKLRPDGTFSFRYAFPDGQIDLPVRATRADGKVTREAKPIVNRRTE